jgi:uncharacterized UPF0160 family protein
MIKKGRIERSFGTHDGPFHADEVTACALLLLFDLIDRDKIVRTRDLQELERCAYVCDVGGVFDPSDKRYDHHQSEYKGELSSAGMVWQDLFKREVVDEELYHFLNRSLILGIDADDNGRFIQAVGWCTFSHVVSNFVPTQYNAPKEMERQGFFEALDFVLGHLRRFLDHFFYVKSCREKVAIAMQKRDGYLLFEEAIPWTDNFFALGGRDHPALFVIMPSGDHWKLRAIPRSSEDRIQLRLPLPDAWAGLSGDELKKVTGIAGAMFCHKGRFFSVWKTKADALKAFELVKGRDT